ncbi:uncharacterized protein N7459_009503 [Penicillium hispanicum]|uniref:uncharacterized protein n=1 Tax=Penicillium hispanicum TaxID=1080232 RepID=UPI0025413413|nr:uncharacterized protein N7459_009503 [Penicillium hispanicum]KAJ5570073.1 hypothetical protein N7459_009503 [Penicillium hispanicum]
MSSGDLTGSHFGLSERSTPNKLAEHTAVACLIAVGWYNVLELIVLCFSTFKRYSGLYFWSLLVASFSIVPFSLGYLLLIFDVYTNLFPVAMELVAWMGMVTGQSLVLWSRLHLIVQNQNILRWTLAMIIVDTIIFHIPGSVLELGSHTKKAYLFDTGFNVFERIQLIGFSIQEIILSLIYSWEAVRLLNLRPRDHYRATLVQLLVVNLAMILMDAAVIGVQYSGLFDVHVTLKAMVYSIKLKMEYGILGKLVDFADTSGTHSQPTDLSDFVDLSYHSAQIPAENDSRAPMCDPELNLQRIHTPSKQFSHTQSHDVRTSSGSGTRSSSNEV